MKTKIVCNGTTLTGIKSCTYQVSLNSGTDLRPGCVSSASIEVEVYGSQSSAPNAGDALTYYQVLPDGTENKIGVFYAEPSIPTKNTYKFVAYDAVSKLDVDFSAWLLANQDRFPLYLMEIVSEACSVAGVSLLTNTFTNFGIPIQKFYADGITCRQVLAWAAEMSCAFVKCNETGRVVFEWYTQSGATIYPTIGSDTEVVPFTTTAASSNRLKTSAIRIKPSEYLLVEITVPGSNTISIDESLSRIGSYPLFSYSTDMQSSLPNHTAKFEVKYPVAFGLAEADVTLYYSDQASSVTITKVSPYVPYKQDGLHYKNYQVAAITRVDIHPIGSENAAYSYPDGGDDENILHVKDNVLLNNATAGTMTTVARTIYTGMNAVLPYTPADAMLFPNENPLIAGEIIPVTDIQGVSFTTIAMSASVTESDATIESSGYEMQDTGYTNPSTATISNNVKINQIETTIIKSPDYATVVQPLIYPDTTTFPEDTLYPSNGEMVTSGFAIDIANGVIYGAFYSEQITALQNRVSALENSLLYPKSP